jgi:hypothetical protein
MVNTWLNQNARPAGARQYRIVDYTEIRPPSAAVKAKLREVLLKHRFDPQALDDLLNTAGLGAWRTYVGGVLPTTRKQKNGTFGEILAGEISETFEFLIVPVRKLRYCSGRNESKHGTDLLAFRLGAAGQLTEVHLSEIKVRISATDRTKAVEAHEQLKEDLSEGFPEILMFVLQRLRELNHPAYLQFLAYMRSRANLDGIEKFAIFLFFEINKWTENNLNELDAVVTLAPLSVHVIRINDFQNLVDEVVAV